MSLLTLRQLLEQALVAVDITISTAWENSVFIPINGIPYQVVDLLLADPENPTIGSPVVPQFYREKGIFQVTLKYPINTGPKDAYTKVQALRDAFPYRKAFTSGSMTVIVLRTPTVSPGRIDGDRWSVPVKIPFFANVSP
jgi:hypothetical protein